MATKSSSERLSPQRWVVVLGIAVLVVTTLFTIVLPTLTLIYWSLMRPVERGSTGLVPQMDQSGLGLFGSTLAWATSVGFITVLVALPGAWVVRRRPGALILLAAPLALPSYFAYGALNLLRAPGSWLGDMAERAAAGGDTSTAVLLGRTIAALSLIIWLYPFALITMVPFVRSISSAVLDAARLDAGGTLRGFLLYLRLCLPALAAGFGLVFIILLGSPVAMHMAQIPTSATRVWITLTINPGDQRAWLEALPIVVFAGLAASYLCGRLILTGYKRSRRESRNAELGGDTAGGAEAFGEDKKAVWGSLAFWAAGVVWCCSVVVPLGLFVGHVESGTSVWRFLRLASSEFSISLLLAAAVACASAVLCLLTWFIGTSRSGREHSKLGLWQPMTVAAFVWLTAMLTPGILVGHTLAVAGRALQHWAFLAGLDLSAVVDSPLPVFIAHLARYGGVGVLCGMLLTFSEPASLRDARTLDGGRPLTSFFHACVLRSGVVLLGLFGAVFCLSLHDTDASIMVQAPGATSLPQLLLGYLHYYKTQELSAACIVLLVGWLVIAGIVAWAWRE